MNYISMQQQCMYVNPMNTIYRVIIVAKWSATRNGYDGRKSEAYVNDYKIEKMKDVSDGI